MERPRWHGSGIGVCFMRRLLVIPCVLGCSAFGFDTTFDVPDITVLGNPSAHAMAIPFEGSAAPFALYVDLSQAAKDNKLPGEIESVTISTLDFAVTGDGCFDFIDDVSLTIAS